MRVAPSACAVRRLRLSNFRNYGSLALDLSAQVVVLSGANGAGKTNLLEALSFLSPGRGLRRARLGEVLRKSASDADEAVTGGEGWAVAATVQGPGGLIRLGSSLATTERGAARRVARRDGQAMAPASLAQVIGVQWLTPQMDRLFLEGPSSRRRFLDRLVLGLDPEHGRRVGAYERSLRERATLLRSAAGDPTWLAALEARMAADGVAVAAARREAVARLQRLLSATSGYFPRPGLAIEGQIEGWLEDHPAVEVESRFAELLQRSRQRDARRGSTSVGPHRSDLAVRHLGKDMPAAQCSTGEQKALLIAVMLANAKAEADRRGAAPILLLDEITAHLDGERRAALFEEILALGGQAWLSGTDRDLFAPLFGQAQFVAVDSGRAMVDG
ncbi:MAG: DNA replication/repair protein RecF [Proteobacteria bacterium]|nr:DNA replication/repair protein RecF [Pseudomonadota bacterium]